MKLNPFVPKELNSSVREFYCTHDDGLVESELSWEDVVAADKYRQRRCQHDVSLMKAETRFTTLRVKKRVHEKCKISDFYFSKIMQQHT